MEATTMTQPLITTVKLGDALLTATQDGNGLAIVIYTKQPVKVETVILED